MSGCNFQKGWAEQTHAPSRGLEFTTFIREKMEEDTIACGPAREEHVSLGVVRVHSPGAYTSGF